MLKIIENYWEAKLRSVYPICCSIGYDCPKNWVSRFTKCILCIGPYKFEQYKCMVCDCQVGSKKICVHITAMCVNYNKNHQTILIKSLVKHKAQKDTKNIRHKKKDKKAKKVMKL